MNHNASSVESLILGSSQSEAGINPHLINNAFNLAMPNGMLEYDDYLLRKYSSHYNQLKRVFLEISYYNLFAQEFEEQPKSRYRAMNYRIYMNYPKHPYSPVYNLESYDLNYLRFHIENGLKYLIKGTPLVDTCDSLGWVGMTSCIEKENYDLFLSDMEKTIKAINCKDLGLATKNIKHLNNMLSYCSQHNITPYIIIMPMTKALIKKLNSNQLYILKEQANSYREQGITILDYLESPLFEKEDFANSNHLNCKGANKLTKELIKTLDLPSVSKE
jgi:hypothetical protein